MRWLCSCLSVLQAPSLLDAHCNHVWPPVTPPTGRTGSASHPLVVVNMSMKLVTNRSWGRELHHGFTRHLVHVRICNATADYFIFERKSFEEYSAPKCLFVPYFTVKIKLHRRNNNNLKRPVGFFHIN